MAHTFGGNKVSQTWNDLFLWELVLNAYPPSRILELGTFTGGMAGYLQMQAMLRNADFQTYDIDTVQHVRQERFDSVWASKHWELPFNLVNVQSEEGVAIVAQQIRRAGRTVLFCDNGNKETEAILYTPHLKTNDVLAVHDWGTECHRVPEELNLYEPEPGIYEELESMTRFFLKP